MRKVDFGPRSEEGGSFCEVTCLRSGKKHGPYLLSNVSRPATHDVEGEYVDDERSGRWTTYGQHPETLERVRVEETHYFRGAMQGKYRRWHPDGTLQEEGNYVSGDRDGAWAMYAPDSTWTFKGSYDRGVPVGTHRQRYINGQLASQEAYDEVGRPHGGWCFWLSDGTEVDCFEVQFGTGEVRRYNRDGKLTHRIQMVDGRRHGSYEEHTHDGGRYVAEYVDGAQHGEEQVLKGDCVTRSVMWDQGVEHGPTYERDCSPEPPRKVVEGEHCRGNPCGKWTMWTDEGNPKQVIEFSETGEVLGKVSYDEAGEIEEFSTTE